MTDSGWKILLSGARTCQEIIDSWITPHVVKPFLKTSRFFFAFFVTYQKGNVRQLKGKLENQESGTPPEFFNVCFFIQNDPDDFRRVYKPRNILRRLTEDYPIVSEVTQRALNF